MNMHLQSIPLCCFILIENVTIKSVVVHPPCLKVIHTQNKAS